MARREKPNQLFETKFIDLRRSPLSNHDPGPMATGFDFERFAGILLGVAIGPWHHERTCGRRGTGAARWAKAPDRQAGSCNWDSDLH